MQIKDTYNQVIKYLGIKKLKKYRLRSPTFFVNLQIVFGCLEKVGDLRIYKFILRNYWIINFRSITL